MVYVEKVKALLRLFKGYEVDETFEVNDDEAKNKLLELGLMNGILFEDLTYAISPTILISCFDMYGVKAEEWNNTFHKSFQTVLDSPIQVLVAQQLIHYFTTYGLESMGLYNKDLVYIPAEKLEIPDFEGKVKLAVIHPLTKQEIGNKLVVLLSSGIALSPQTLADVKILIEYIDKCDIEKIKNREIKNILYDMYDIVPSNNMEFFRYLIYKTTGGTLLIKNKTMINKIKKCNKTYAYNLIKQYVKTNGSYKELAKIFLRYKDLFLAYKIHDMDVEYLSNRKDMNKIINKVSKLADKYHERLQDNILDKISNIQEYSEYLRYKDEILEKLNKITIFREVRILNGLKYRVKLINDSTSEKQNSMVYKIRNNKVYATKLKNLPTKEQVEIYKELITLIENHLVTRLQDNFKDKVFYIPENVRYAMPTSEKQFIGNLPMGTQIVLPRYDNMIVGVFWTNLDNERVDLDLKAMNEDEEIGWNASYRNLVRQIAFSGDVTDAPKPTGATETMLIGSDVANTAYTLKLNNFTRNKANVPFEFFVAGTSDKITTRDRMGLTYDYAVNPNDIIMSIKNAFYNDKDSNRINTTLTLGQVCIEDKNVIISLIDYEDVSNSVSSMDNVNWHIHNYNKLYKDAQLSLNDMIVKCGGKVVTTDEIEKYEKVGEDENGEAIYKKVVTQVDYDLSLETLEKDTLIKLLV